MSSLNTSKMERTKQSKGTEETSQRILPLVIKPNGLWAYKFGSMYPKRS